MMRACRTTLRSASAVAPASVSEWATVSVFAVVLVMSTAVAWPIAHAQDGEFFEPPGLRPPPGAMAALAQAGQPEWQFGFQLFHMLLEQKGLYSRSVADDPLGERPEKTAVVLVGDLSGINDGLRSRLRTFVERGGALLIATDQTAYIRDFCLIQQGPVEAASKEAAFQGFRDCPLITRLRSDSSLTSGVTSLVANRCGFIARTSDRMGNWKTSAWLPDEAQTAGGRGSGMPLISELQTRRNRHGRAVIIADHSMFINGMLWHADNAKFAVNMTDWLTEGGRKELLFLVDGEPVQSVFAMPPMLPDELPSLDQLPPPTLEDLARLPKDTLLKFTNRFIAGMEDADVMNELIADQPAELETSEYRQALYIAAGILAGVYILRAMGRAGQQPPAPPPRAIGLLSATGRIPRLSSSDLHRAGRELAQNALRQLTGSTDSLDWMIPVHDVEIDAHFFRRASVRSSLKKLKKLASSTDRTHTTQRDLRQIARLIADVLGLQKEGRLRHSSILS